MPKLLEIEELESDLPLLAILGENEAILNLFIHEFANKFRLILISEKKPSFLHDNHKIYFLTYKSAVLLPKLKDTLEYAIVLISEKTKSENIAPLFSKIRLDKAKVLFLNDVFSLKQNIDLLKEYQGYQRSIFASIGEVISLKKLEGTGLLSKIIENAIAKKEIKLSGNEAFPVYATFENDLLTGVGRLLFGNISNDKYYLLYYKHPETVLNATHLMGRVDQEIRIIFSEIHKPPFGILRNEVDDIIKHRLNLNTFYVDSFYLGFEKGFLMLLEKRNKILKNHKVNLTHDKLAKLPVKKNHLSFILSSLFFGIFTFLFLNLLSLGLCILFLKNSIDGLKRNDFTSSSQSANASKIFLSFIRPTATLTIDMINIFDKSGEIEKKYLILEQAVRFVDIAKISIKNLSKKEFDIKNLNSSLSNFSYLYQEGQRLILNTDNKDLKTQLKPTYSKLLSFSSVLPYILGFDGTRNYLLLFQNNEELRPTGGFIGSVGDLRVKDAKIENLTIQDVYEYDGQLKNHVEPPFVVRRYLQPHLYLRDSNFSLNFQEAASTSAFIYNLETGREPDGVIAIDLEVLKKVMQMVGPIKLESYNITVTSDNISDFIQSTIKNNFFPGSTQKKDVLNSVFTQLTLKVSNDPKLYFSLIKLLPDLLEQKNILVSFSKNSVQKIFSANNYAGEYFYNKSLDTKTISDFLYINEANIGVNKVNANIKRSVTYEAMLEQGRVFSKVRLTLTNNSKKDDYKFYVKLAVPSGSTLSQILINNVKQNITPAVTDFKIYEEKNFKAPSGLETEQYTVGDFTYFAFIATAKLGHTTTIGVDYINGAGKQLKNITNYLLSYVKQPGTLPYEVTTTFYYPEGYMPVNTQADSYGKNFLEKKQIAEKDFTVKFELQKSSVEK